MKKKVCIDAGHSGKYNRSPVNGLYYESDFTFKLQTYLAKQLELLGVDVCTTRSSQDTVLGLAERGRLSAGCDLFISLHSNACSTPSVNRITVFHMVEDRDIVIDDLSKSAADLLGKAVFSVMPFVSNYSLASKRSSMDKDKDGKFDDEYYGVLSSAKFQGTPAVLVEHGFHTNKEVADWLLIDSNVKKLAVAESLAIAEYLGMGNTAEDTGGSVLQSTDSDTSLTNSVDLTKDLPKASTTSRYRVKDLKTLTQVSAYKFLSNAKRLVDSTTDIQYGVFDSMQNDLLVYANSRNSSGYSVEITASALRVRSDASITSKSLGALKMGIVTTVLEERSSPGHKWGKVEYNNKTGWVCLDYVKRV